MKIKKIEDKQDWLKLIIDGGSGTSNFSGGHEEHYIKYCTIEGTFYTYDKWHQSKGEADISFCTSDFGIIEEPKTKVLKEYMYYTKKAWYVDSKLRTNEEATDYYDNTLYKPTGREFIVPV